MRTAKRRGCHSNLLFGVIQQGAPSDGWQNISIFKRKFGGMEVRFMPSLKCVYDPAHARNGRKLRPSKVLGPNW